MDAAKSGGDAEAEIKSPAHDGAKKCLKRSVFYNLREILTWSK